MTDANGCEFELGPYFVDDVVPVAEAELFESLKIFPNPSSGVLNIKFESKETLDQFEIFNLQGILIHNEMINVRQDFKSIDLSSFSDGIYFIRFKMDDKIFTQRFILAR